MHVVSSEIMLTKPMECYRWYHVPAILPKSRGLAILVLLKSCLNIQPVGGTGGQGLLWLSQFLEKFGDVSTLQAMSAITGDQVAVYDR